ncbi:MAG: twin-arginine translocation signal domain-containing protein [Planctomycetaceae bacterium]|nr:twin-arginine translocation signal domain-containing protein [Planctomycetaceae bacterium]
MGTRRHFLKQSALLGGAVLIGSQTIQVSSVAAQPSRSFRAGAYAIDITPTKLPVIVNGGFFPRSVEKVNDPLHARCLVLDDGTERIVLIVVDNCKIPMSLADETKWLIEQETNIRRDRIMISATHTHSAPSLVYTLGTPPDADYADWVPKKIVEGVAAAVKNLAPAKVGWAVGNDPNNVYCRRFLMKEGTATTNPFSGKSNDRAMMNPGHANPNKITRTGPVDTAVSVLSLVSLDDKPIAVLGNYSTHYAGVPGDVLSADYFAVFAERIKGKLAEKIGAENVPDSFVGIMSNGTSGDANCIDFLNPERQFDYKSVGEETAQAAMVVLPNIQYFDWVPLKMVERRITVRNRVPTSAEVQAAKAHLAALPGGELKTVNDIYAQSTVAMENWSATSEIPLQAIRIGDLGITALPGEIYGITGLEIKARSPFIPTFNISMANGGFGYIPPEEQHRLGGYNTWRTQGSCLEVNVETIVRQTVIDMLEELR